MIPNNEEMNKELNKSIWFLTKQLFYKIIAILSLIAGCLIFLKCIAWYSFFDAQPSNMELLLIWSGFYFSDIDEQ